MEKKVAIVTGGSGGIGSAICDVFFKNGFEIFNLDIEITNNYNTIKCDVSNENDVIKARNIIRDKCEGVDVLINTAGIFCYKNRDEISNLSFEEWKKVLNINLNGVFLCSKYFIPLLKKSNNYPSIINISSDQAIHPRKKGGAYGVSKAAISSFTKLLACELAKYKIRVNEVAAASVKSNFINKYFSDRNIDVDKVYEDMEHQMPFGLIMPDSVADAVFYLSTKEAKNITGQTLLIDSGYLL